MFSSNSKLRLPRIGKNLVFPGKVGTADYISSYDLLCIEGIARALRVYLGLERPVAYKLKLPPGGEADLVTVNVDSEVREDTPLCDA